MKNVSMENAVSFISRVYSANFIFETKNNYIIVEKVVIGDKNMNIFSFVST